jgi:hypothetical protein
MSRTVHLVGSIPLANAAEVFETVSTALDGRLVRLPDGETGIRSDWINSLGHIFEDHPAFVRSDEVYSRRGTPGTETWFRYDLADGVRAEDVRFDGYLTQAKEAIESYSDFARLKSAGVVPNQVRYQVQLTPAPSVMRRWVVEAHQEALEPHYDAALVGEVTTMAEAIPVDQLAVQWDVASSVFERLELGEPTRYGATVDEMIETFGRRMARLGEGVPEGVELLYHLCYGDNSHKHTIEPRSTELMVRFANFLTRETARPIQLVHMPVPRSRTDDAYFEPLRSLDLAAETTVALGLVHYTDGVEGSLERGEVAKRYRADFAVATECGFGRRDPSTVPALLEIHAAVADAL